MKTTLHISKERERKRDKARGRRREGKRKKESQERVGSIPEIRPA